MEGYDKKRIKLLHAYQEVLASIIFITESASYYQQNPKLIFKRKRDTKRMLESWQISDREGLTYRLEWLMNTGTRKVYDELHISLGCIDMEERERYIASFQTDLVRQREIELVNDYLHRLPFGIIGYDISSAAYLIGSGRVMKYLSEVEHIEYLEKMLELVKHYNMDRKDYINSYVVGTIYNTLHVKPEQEWRTNPQGLVSNNHLLYTRLIASKRSPFKRIGM